MMLTYDTPDNFLPDLHVKQYRTNTISNNLEKIQFITIYFPFAFMMQTVHPNRLLLGIK